MYKHFYRLQQLATQRQPAERERISRKSLPSPGARLHPRFINNPSLTLSSLSSILSFLTWPSFLFTPSVCCKLHFLKRGRGISGRSVEMGNSKVEWMNSFARLPREDIKSKLQFSFSPAKTCWLSLSFSCLLLEWGLNLHGEPAGLNNRRLLLCEGLAMISPRSDQRHSAASQRDRTKLRVRPNVQGRCGVAWQRPATRESRAPVEGYLSWGTPSGPD